MEQRLNGNLAKMADKVAQLVQQVAKLNGEIKKIKGIQGNIPNEMLDLRDQLTRELSSVIGINVITQDDSININFANGLSLINGTKVNKINAMASEADPAHITLAFDDGINLRHEIDPTSITGGELASALAVRDEVLQPNRQKINHLGLILVESINQVQQAGFDLQGNVGQALSQTGQPSVISNNQNQGTSSFDTKFTDATQVKGIDYAMMFDGTNRLITELATGVNVGSHATCW
ncbi:MAG: hypothetical protein AB8W37_08405 [Arsenophonus endosymbiont of Dermacentor nuttalli]